MCTNCVSDGSWNNVIADDEPCDICGPNRLITFSSFELPDPSVSGFHVVSADPLKSFLDHMLGFEGCATYLFAHNGGRYGTLLSVEFTCKLSLILLSKSNSCL